MNIYFATFRKTDDPAVWKFITKIYRADYVEEARENATKDWNANFSGYRMTFSEIPYFEEFNSAKVSEVFK
jgi:hypothetical protein